MEERSNKTIMCSVFFLDIVEYSKKSVAGQISLKDRFNSYLSAAICDVPITDRIILDTGDGAAINFLGDVEDALKAALSLRESLLNEDPNLDPPLLVRMGINLGPVRLVRDINGQPNIVGDGINVAQRVMSFADASQILVSRSYYDAVSRLSPQYAGMFHYQGSRTDKHVREHEVYAIGYPGDKTTQRRPTQPVVAEQAESPLARAMERAKTVWRSAATRLDALMEYLITRFRQAGPKQRALYVGAAAVPLLLLVVLLVNLARHDEIPAIPTGMDEQAVNTTQPSSAVEPVSSVQASSAVEPVSSVLAVAESKPEMQKIVESKKAKDKPKPKRPEGQPKAKTQDAVVKKDAVAAPSGNSKAYLSVRCIEGTEVFMDGTRKGRISGSSLTIKATPGTHSVIVSHSRGVYSRNIVFEAGKTVRLNPDFCN